MINTLKPTVSGQVFRHDFVDLGLPSGRLWATCNIGAYTPTQRGNYFAWGETITRSNDYNYSNYKWAQCVYPGSLEFLKKYSTLPLGNDETAGRGQNGEPIYIAHWEGHQYQLDHIGTLECQDDAASVNWSSVWKMPTKKDFEELIYGCDWSRTDSLDDSGVPGYIGVSKTNGNVIFFPVNDSVSFQFNDKNGYYWSSEIDKKDSCKAYALKLATNEVVQTGIERCYGLSVRAVVSDKTQVKSKPVVKSEPLEEKINEVSVSGNHSSHDYVDLGLPSGMMWATCNVGATNPMDYGDYFAWGETKPKDEYSWNTYKHCTCFVKDKSGKPMDFTRYCKDPKYGTVDPNNALQPEDDAATANWGGEWRMPTVEEQRELHGSCEWKFVNGYNDTDVSGFVGVSKYNGNKIFFPYRGLMNNLGRDNSVNKTGCYWSMCYPVAFQYGVPEDYEKCAAYAMNFAFEDHLEKEMVTTYNVQDKYIGMNVRAVCKL